MQCIPNIVLHIFNHVANITVYSDSVIIQEKNDGKGDFLENAEDKNETNRSIKQNTIKIVKENMSKTIE